MAPRRGSCVLLVAFAVCSVSSLPHHNEIPIGGGGLLPEDQGDLGGYGPQQLGLFDGNGCSCQFFVDSTVVSKLVNNGVWHSCSGWGLSRCGQYCDEQFHAESVRFKIRQNACDTLGEDTHTSWYRRHQVCGMHGPYQDVLLSGTADLCCRRGRPSDTC